MTATIERTTAGTPHGRAERDPRRWFTLGVLCVSLLVIVIDNTIVNVALPTLVRDLGSSISDLQWVVDAYSLVFAGLLLAARAVMGIGAALIMPATLSILTNVFTDARERALAIGLWSGVAGIAVAAGPVT